MQMIKKHREKAEQENEELRKQVISKHVLRTASDILTILSSPVISAVLPVAPVAPTTLGDRVASFVA